MTQEGYDFLLWFYQRADFGPADGDVREHLMQCYTAETGKEVPDGFRGEE